MKGRHQATFVGMYATANVVVQQVVKVACSSQLQCRHAQQQQPQQWVAQCHAAHHASLSADAAACVTWLTAESERSKAACRSCRADVWVALLSVGGSKSMHGAALVCGTWVS